MSGTSNVLLVFLIVTTVVSLGALLINLKTTSSRIRRIHDDYRAKIDAMTRDRDNKLFSQSKYSELGMMSAGIAHEINNPLAVIQARTTQLLRMYRDPEKQQEVGEGLQQILYTSE